MVKRKAVGFLMSELGLSERRSCRIVGLTRSVQQYRPKPRDDEAVVERMKVLASEKRAYEKPSEKRIRKEAEAVPCRRELERKRALRDAGVVKARR